MLKKIDELRKQWDQQRPLRPDFMHTIAQKFREEWTYHSNAIKGNHFGNTLKSLIMLKLSIFLQGITMNVILMRNGLPPAIIRKESREESYIALEKADHGNLEPNVQLIAIEVKHSLELILSV